MMGEAIVTILIFFGVITITALVFGGWVIVSIIRLLLRGVQGMLGMGSSPRIAVSGTVQCPREGCRAHNPSGARFCRRCGTALPETQRVSVRRAAMW